MTDQEQIEAIAELRGWKRCGGVYPSLETGDDVQWWKKDGEVGEVSDLPKWPTDLNACKELIEDMHTDGLVWRLDSGLDGTWEANLFSRTGTLSVYAPADTLERAICRAFLEHHKKFKE